MRLVEFKDKIMELELIRTYYERGTNSEILHDGGPICYAIELPWKNNQHGVSCVPEGRYELSKRYSDHFGWHLQVMDVPERDLILIHPANDAVRELRGCIAPVSLLTDEGKGLQSRIAFEKIKSLVFPLLEKGEQVLVNIQKKL